MKSARPLDLPTEPATLDELDRRSRGMTRRQFGKVVAALSALGCIEPQFVARALGASPKRLSWLAYRTASGEGAWRLTDIEGEVPEDLRGTLYRVAPGQKENYGTTLRHFFDGDAFLSGFSFRDGKITLRNSFIATPERTKELAAGKMLYSEFGTLAPKEEPKGEGEEGVNAGPLDFKNQPNVNVVHYDGRLLALSEGGHPTAVDPQTLKFQSTWDFHGTLPPFVPFTAHPKYDPETGEAFGYGVAQGPGMALNVFRLEPNGRLHKLHEVPQQGYFMIHDMLITRNHLVFVIPPVQFDFAVLFAGKGSVADALSYLEDQPTRFLVLDRAGGGEPTVIEQPANMVFHNGNAYEQDGKLVVDTILSPDDGPLELLKAFSKDELPEVEGPQLTRMVIDLEKREVVSRDVFGVQEEFPRFDVRQSGTNARYLYTMEAGIANDPLIATRLVRHDLHGGTSQRYDAGKGRGLGETVFVPRPEGSDEDDGWLLLQGYDAERDENFLEVRDAATLDFAARAWTGQHFPLGFHGNFVADEFVAGV